MRNWHLWLAVVLLVSISAGMALALTDQNTPRNITFIADVNGVGNYGIKNASFLQLNGSTITDWSQVNASTVAGVSSVSSGDSYITVVNGSSATISANITTFDIRYTLVSTYNLAIASINAWLADLQTSNSTTNARVDALNTTKLDVTDQRYNDSVAATAAQSTADGAVTVNSLQYANITALQSFRDSIYTNTTLLQAFDAAVYTNVTGTQSSIATLSAFDTAIYVNVTALQTFRNAIYTNTTALQAFDAAVYVNVTALQTGLGTVNSTAVAALTGVAQLNTTKQNDIGSDCTPGNFVKGVDDDGTLDCDAPAGGGDITAVQTTGDTYLYNGSASGDVVLRFNETALNATIDARAGSGGVSYNQSLNTTDNVTFMKINVTGYLANSPQGIKLGAPSTTASQSSKLYFGNGTYYQDYVMRKIGNRFELRMNGTPDVSSGEVLHSNFAWINENITQVNSLLYVGNLNSSSGYVDAASICLDGDCRTAWPLDTYSNVTALQTGLASVNSTAVSAASAASAAQSTADGAVTVNGLQYTNITTAQSTADGAVTVNGLQYTNITNLQTGLGTVNSTAVAASALAQTKAATGTITGSDCLQNVTITNTSVSGQYTACGSGSGDSPFDATANLTKDIRLGDYKLYTSDSGTAYISKSPSYSPRLYLNGGGEAIEWDNYQYVLLANVNNEFRSFSASNTALNVTNTGAGKADLYVENDSYSASFVASQNVTVTSTAGCMYLGATKICWNSTESSFCGPSSSEGLCA